MTSAEYQAYRSTEGWQARRLRSLELAGEKCQICSCNETLEVHHNTYENVDPGQPGTEPDCDLVVLCARCHHAHHLPDVESDGERFWPYITMRGGVFHGPKMRRVGIDG